MLGRYIETKESLVRHSRMDRRDGQSGPGPGGTETKFLFLTGTGTGP
jgi:hypothetical protein